MKKLICLILSLALTLGLAFAMTACGDEEGNDNVDPVTKICNIVGESAPTRIITQTDYVVNGIALGGEYITEIEGNNSILTYSYEKMSDPMDGNSNPHTTVSGKIYYKDGRFSEDGITWKTGAPSTTPIIFNVSKDVFVNPVVSQDGYTLTAEITPEAALAAFGTDLAAEGNLVVEIVTDGTNLRDINISGTTAQGASVMVRTSYTYTAVTLEFPGAA